MRSKSAATEIEALGVEQRADQALFVQIDHAAGLAAERPGGLDALGAHAGFEEACGRRRRAAGSRLHREAFVEVARVLHHVRRKAGDQEFARVRRGARRADGNLRGISHLIDLDDPVDLILTDRRRRIREGNDLLGQHHDIARVMRVDHGVAERTATRAPRHAIGVAEWIAGGHAQEGDVDGDLAAFDQRDTTAVGVDVDRLVHQAVGNRLGELAAHSRGIDASDEAGFDVLDQHGVGGLQRGRGQRQVLEAHAREDVDHHVDGLVAFAKTVMERDGHPVLQAGAANGFLDRIDDLAIELGGWAGEMRRLGGKAGEDFAPIELRQGGKPSGELDCHGLLAFSYFRTPEAAASCKTRWACATTGASTILPLTETTPSPSFSAFAAAATTRRA